jgi:S-DNA-T family DNA segregation ATPase FtsK/SpoIIIE
VRLHGVFVSDAEVHGVTKFWRDQSEPNYNSDLLQGAADDDGADGGGRFAFLIGPDSDQMLPAAAQLVTDSGRASTSMLQTKLKVGFNRATRLMDDLEKHGIIGPADPRNPATPRQIYGPENWLRGTEDADTFE